MYIYKTRKNVRFLCYETPSSFAIYMLGAFQVFNNFTCNAQYVHDAVKATAIHVMVNIHCGIMDISCAVFTIDRS